MASSSQIPFAPLGDTITFAAATPTPPAGQQAPIRPNDSTGDAGSAPDHQRQHRDGVFREWARHLRRAIANTRAQWLPLCHCCPALMKCCGSVRARFLQENQRAGQRLFTSRRDRVCSSRKKFWKII